MNEVETMRSVSAVRMEKPAGPREVAEALAACAKRGEKILPVGAGRSLAWAGAPDPCDVALSLEGVDGVVDYSPDDMTITVLAGTPLEAVRRTLEGHSQRLPGLPEGEGTLGGLLATGWTAAEARESQGALRERLLGAQIADTAGRLTRSGGRVVKNVTGYDLHRMHVGAGGAFGVFTELTFRLEPLPEHSAEVTLEAPSADVAREAWRWLRLAGPDAAWVVLRTEALVAVVEGDDEPARRATHEIAAGWSKLGTVRTGEARTPEKIQGETSERPRLSVALRAAPSGTLALFERLRADERLRRLATDWVAYPQSGEVCLRLAGAAEELTSCLRAIAESAAGDGPSYRVQDETPEFLPPDLPRWSADPAALRLLARLKRTLDPSGLLRPGSYSADALERAASYFAGTR